MSKTSQRVNNKTTGITLFMILYSLSGFAVMSMETIWIRTLALIIGNTVNAATAAICVFFIFAAFGNLIGGRLVHKTTKPAAWYGVAEICFAVSAFLLYPVASRLEPSSYGVFTDNIRISVILVAVPSLFAGMSLPFLLQSFVWNSETRTGTGGSLYAGNLLGAALGVIGGGILLPMKMGYQNSVYLIAFLGATQGAIALLWARTRSAFASSEESQKKKKTTDDPGISKVSGYLILALSGILSLGIELLIMQYFRQFAIGTVYSVSAVLFAFMAGISAGSALAALLRRKGYKAGNLLAFFLWGSAFMCALYSWIFHTLLADAIRHGGFISGNDLSVMKHAWYTILKTTAIMLPLLIFTGTVFPLAWELTDKNTEHQGLFFGNAVFVNKTGCALGVVIVPFVLVPWLGLNTALIAVGGGFAATALFFDLIHKEHARNMFSALLVRSAVVGVIVRITFQRGPDVISHPGEKLLAVYGGAGTITAVIDDERGSRHIVLNQQYILNGTQQALGSQQNESWIPLCITPKPERVAFIGVASGISAAAALDFPIKELEAIEIIPDVEKAARKWFREWNAPLFCDSRCQVVIEDGRRVIASSPAKYDCVICDLVLPAGEATNDLYSKDFMERVRSKLTKNGTFCIWLPMYQMDEELAGIVIKTFASVYPYAVAVRGNLDPVQNTLGLIGSNLPIDLSSATLAERLASLTDSSVVRRSDFFRSAANFRLVLTGDLKALGDKLSAYPVTTDNNPVFAFRGPKNIANGSALRALTYLKWAGKMFPMSDFPSCRADSSDILEMTAGLRAGNYYYAAAISSAPIPVSAEKQNQRYLQTMQYINFAKKLSPLSDINLSNH